MGNYGEGAKSRIKIIRLRTWALTLTTLTLLVFYIFVTLSLKSRIDWIDFAITVAIQLSTHFAYFPDGERYGEMDPLFKRARKLYNVNANHISEVNAVEDLRDFCKVDFYERKARYIADICGSNGISVEEFNELAQKSKKELRAIKSFEYNGRTIYFTQKRRAAIIKLAYGRCPVKPNSPDLILSAVDRNYADNIRDDQKVYRGTTHAIKIFRYLILGGVLAYINYNTRDGINFAAVVKSAVFIGSMIAAAVSSYISGERSTREFKKEFYIELYVFISRFFSWKKISPPEVDEE